ncbi:MAG: hypothetical protein J7M18_06150 [Candidatus Eremiobacteraeota bacterium]|nr:hypothetical protein [Candidatus Eremiobacteraeota bacterium]
MKFIEFFNMPQDKKTEFSKVKSFHSRITGKIYFLSLLPVIVAAWLIYQGINNYDVFYEPAMKALFSIMPISLGIITILVLAILLMSNTGKVIEMTPQKITYKHRNLYFAVLWGSLSFSEIQPESIFASILISDGKHFGKIDRLFFPDYDEILRILKYARRNVKEDILRV